jgi:alpha-tubulin suppressor-like RCC1 family protein
VCQLTPSSPAHIPGLVHDLTDLPTGSITKIAANGYMIGALTAGEDLYCWGVQHRARTKPILDGLQDRPNLVDVDGKDIEDFGIGDSHVIVLTVEDELWVIGDNANGQLGIEAEEATTWTKVNIELEPDRSVVAVRAGPKCSFLIVEVSEKFSGDEGADARPKKRKRLSYPV